MTPTSRPGRAVDVAVEGFRGSVLVREDGPRDAPPVLLIHGFCGSMAWYDPVVARIDDRLRVIRVDLLGHGGTGGPAADAPLQGRVVGAVLEQLGLDDVTAVGHSFGADVAVELAERSPRVTRLMIITQAPDYSDATLPRAQVLATVPFLGTAVLRSAKVASIGLGAVLRRRRSSSQAVTALLVQGLQDFRALNLGMFRVVLVERRDRMAARPLDVQLTQAGTPTLVLLGGRDHFYGDRSAERYRRAGAQVEILPESGHSPTVEQPDAVAELVCRVTRFAGAASDAPGG